MFFLQASRGRGLVEEDVERLAEAVARRAEASARVRRMCPDGEDVPGRRNARKNWRFLPGGATCFLLRLVRGSCGVCFCGCLVDLTRGVKPVFFMRLIVRWFLFAAGAWISREG